MRDLARTAAAAACLFIAACDHYAPPPPVPRSGFYRFDEAAVAKNCADPVQEVVEKFATDRDLGGSAEREPMRVAYFLHRPPSNVVEVFYRFDDGERELELALLGPADWTAADPRWNEVRAELALAELWRQLLKAAACG